MEFRWFCDHRTVMSSELQIDIENVSVERRGFGKFVYTKRNNRINYLHVFFLMDWNICHIQLILHTMEFELIRTPKYSEASAVPVKKYLHNSHAHCADMLPITQKYAQTKEESEIIEETEFVTLYTFHSWLINQPICIGTSLKLFSTFNRQ